MIYDRNHDFRGRVWIKLDWGQHLWSIADHDMGSVWEHVCRSDYGSFEPKPWFVIWLGDQYQPVTLIFREAPMTYNDGISRSGWARMYAPVDPQFIDALVYWEIESYGPQPLSALRKRARQWMANTLPAPYGSKNWRDNLYHSKKPGTPGYTNCVEYPAYIALKLNGGKKAKIRPGYPPTTTKGWTAPGGNTIPRPGDIFILCKTAKHDGTTAHVGMVYDDIYKDGKRYICRTGDWGQGSSGWDGDWVNRTYDPAAHTLTGDKNNPRPPRAIKGWVDLDVLFS